MSDTFKPYISADQNIPEVTVASVLLGVILGIILAAANTYLGLYAGMTVSASIPAAVISMGLLRGLLRRGTVLENNIVQTIASTGESLAAGVIFTVPALLLTGVWTEVQFWPTTIICISGGLLGILFMIPLRKSHIVDDKTLTFPEGVACAEVIKTGETGGQGIIFLGASMAIGAVLKLFTSGVNLLQPVVEWAGKIGNTAIYFGTDISAALVGVGYIIRFNIAALMFLGGAVGWLVAIPLIGLNSGVEGDAMEWFWTAWSTKVRYIGVGSMIVGGIWSIISIREGIVNGFKEALQGYRAANNQSSAPTLRTEVSMNQKHLLLMLIGVMGLVFVLYNSLIASTSIALVSTVSMVALSFFFVAVASYIVGLVGSSSSPVSGMTICAVMATGGLLLLLGMDGTAGIIATLGVAGVVCCAACTAGDISQDLKTGYLLGATPKRQQWMEVLGATIPALFIAPVVMILHKAYGIGTGEPGALKAPQASLFASLTNALFGDGTLPWNFVIIGAIVGVVIIVGDQILKSKNSQFRMPIMAVAVGIYLPLSLSVPILVGGLMSALSRNKSEGNNGVLFASGLIAGEALIGVAIGTFLYLKQQDIALEGIQSIASVLVLLALGGTMALIAARDKSI